MNDVLSQTLSNAPDDFLRLLRALMHLHNAGARQLDAARQEVQRLNTECGDGLAQAHRLGLVDSEDPEHLGFTALGKQVCDGVKQYVNWLDHADELPIGVRPEMVKGKEILDVGCGVGCALLTFGRHGAAGLTGADMMATFPAMARVFAARQKLQAPLVVLADGARLPFPDRSFDLVFCRLAINYMHSEDALAEMARVARDGADLVICLNMLRWHMKTMRKQLSRLQWKGLAFDLFRMGNGLLLHTLHRQITLSYAGQMFGTHSPVWHTPWTMRRQLARWSFDCLWDNATEHADTPTFHARRRPRETTMEHDHS
ncbi:MAG: class I SAM-dependent methyltransferase [Phycisphaerae bacterium]|nr:class I SAM-dependent methyltransferase [Phycisphaerae bacterium]